MISSNVVVSDKVDCDIVIKSGGSLILSGMSSADITLEEFSSFTLSGMANGVITIQKNSSAIISGMATGKVVLNGGKICITGIVAKFEQIDGECHIEKGAIVNGQKY